MHGLLGVGSASSDGRMPREADHRPSEHLDIFSAHLVQVLLTFV